ncbi:hypothetical protein ES708_14525 [subsurface metagenome]
MSSIDPTKNQVNSLLRLRDRVRSCIIEGIGGQPSLFMAGSFKKKTMIKQHYDLDMFIIWSPDFSSLKNLFYEVGMIVCSTKRQKNAKIFQIKKTYLLFNILFFHTKNQQFLKDRSRIFLILRK